MPRTTHPGGHGDISNVITNKEERNEILATLASISLTRAALARGLGKQYGGERDVYAALGWKKELCFADFYYQWQRGNIAKRIVEAFPEATWRGEPVVFETEDPKQVTTFEASWAELLDNFDVWHFLTRTDKLARMGKYAVLYFGFDDGEPSQPLQKSTNRKLLYLQPYSEPNATINTWDKDKTSPRYGMPETYKLKVRNLNNAVPTSDVRAIQQATSTEDMVVHWSRIIHVAENLLESNVYGTPAMECVYNNLSSLELIAGGSGEMFWRGAFPGLALEMDPTAQVADESALNDEIDEYVHNMRRVLRLKGIQAKSLTPGILSDPEKYVDTQLKLIAGATKIPVRILTGSEMGELASTQDKENWEDRVAERRNDFAEPVLLRPFIEKLIESGVLPAPGNSNGFSIAWPDIEAQSDKEQAEIGEIRAKALQAYVTSGAHVVVPPMQFLVNFLGFTEEEAIQMLEEVERMLEEEAKEAEAAQATVAEEEAARAAEAGAAQAEGATEEEAEGGGVEEEA